MRPPGGLPPRPVAQIERGGNIIDHYGGPVGGPERTAGGGTGGWATLSGAVYTLTGAYSNAPNYGDWIRQGGYSATVGGSEGLGLAGDAAYAEAMYHPEREIAAAMPRRGPRAYQRSDDTIGEDIHRRLTDDPWVDATDVEVQIERGIVRLSGTVHDRQQKRRAENVVAAAPGVIDVFNALEIAAPGSRPRTAKRTRPAPAAGRRGAR